MKKFRIFPLVLILCLALSAAAPTAWALDAPSLNGKAAVLVDLDSGRVLYGHNENDERAVASLTKVMTVLLALEALDSGRIALEDMVTAQDDCQEGMEDDSSTSGIVPGTVISVKDLLYCAMLQSANEACNILGRYLAGSIAGFVEQMNQRAAELGCQHTHFANTNGLPAEGHYSSAYDQYLIFAEAMQHPMFLSISNTASYQADCAAVASGTATLEAALAHCPTVLVYAVSALFAWFARRVITGVKHIGLANVIAEKSGVEPPMPELLQEAFTPEAVAAQLSAWLTDAEARARASRALDAVMARLHSDGDALGLAAREIREVVHAH